MNWNTTERVVAAAVAIYAFIIYTLTVAPTASFWDAGEFIAISHGLQVSHPPGAPFYMLVGRLFSMFVPVAYISLAVNMVSVVASALTILLTHLIIVRLARTALGADDDITSAQRLMTLIGGVIGATTFAVTDSFWFNAVEAEVYALSMFFTAIVVWLALRWSELARLEEANAVGGTKPFGLEANRYLLLIAYLFGLAIGVHLLNLLAIFFVGLIFFFQEYERPTWTNAARVKGIIVAGLVSAGSFLLVYPIIIQKLPDWADKSGAPVLFMLGVVALVVGAVYFTHQRRLAVGNLLSLSILLVLIGYSSYAVIFIRSNANPPIDENDPENTEAIVSYLKREQYGDTPIVKGNSYNNRLGRIDDRREVLFPRRHSSEPSHINVYDRYSSDLDFFFNYQVGHMYLRYFGWNFVGKASDRQDAATISGIFPEANPPTFQTPSEHASRNRYFMLPLLLGLIGGLWHARTDWRRAFSVFVLFFMTGLGIILYLNQPPLQPRERDYSYVASFFAFSLWVGLGATGVLALLAERVKAAQNMAPQVGLGLLLFAAVPGWMLIENYDDHDRSGRYVAPDYAYNMLIGLEENAIIFTNGDNDTFPLWYLQEVEGVRQDVRVVNLSLLNTSWYIKQLKNQSAHTSAPLPISMDDRVIENLAPSRWEPRTLDIPVDLQTIQGPDTPFENPAEDLAQFESPMKWTIPGRPFSQDINFLYVADQAVIDIVATNARNGWERPIYFAVTVAQSGQLNLQNYFQLEGQAFRVVPLKHNEGQLGRVVPEITAPNLNMFQFRGIDDPAVYFDENIRNMVDNYRTIYAHVAEQMAAQGEIDGGLYLLDEFVRQVPFTTIPGDDRSFFLVARAYTALGDQTKAIALLDQARPMVLQRFASGQRSERALQIMQLIQLGYANAGAFESAAALSDSVATLTGDESIRVSAEELRQFMGMMPR